ncbi:hypothetical protein NQZ68_008747 [Dissostichus eleginoides]|nr:hypothetical protein NQZ68_008747 [Dissostichus eleginoides]
MPVKGGGRLASYPSKSENVGVSGAVLSEVSVVSLTEAVQEMSSQEQISFSLFRRLTANEGLDIRYDYPSEQIEYYAFILHSLKIFQIFPDRRELCHMGWDSCWEGLTDKIPASSVSLYLLLTALWLGNRFRGQGCGALLKPKLASGRTTFSAELLSGLYM